MNENLIFAEPEPAWAHTPEWGPSHLRAEGVSTLRAALDLRDGAGEMPDDN